MERDRIHLPLWQVLVFMMNNLERHKKIKTGEHLGKCMAGNEAVRFYKAGSQFSQFDIVKLHTTQCIWQVWVGKKSIVASC